MKFFAGDIIKLSGKTRHGKNRIRENGDMWKVINTDGQDSSVLSTKICVIPVDMERRENWSMVLTFQRMNTWKLLKLILRSQNTLLWNARSMKQ